MAKSVFHHKCLWHICIFFVQYISCFANQDNLVVIATKQIYLEKFPDAHNPSIIKTDKGYLCCFRYQPNYYFYSWISYIGIVELDETFTPVSQPQLLKTRSKNNATPSQSEDARLFCYDGRRFLIYNDNIEESKPNYFNRRDIFIAELLYSNGHYFLSAPQKLIHEKKYNLQWQQKNWIPFEYKSMLLFIYTINPHEIIYPNFLNGTCYPYFQSEADIMWSWGQLRGSSAAVLDEDEYLVFFHSGVQITSKASFGLEMWHYFMGAYTFSAEPPFHITKISSIPIIAEGFYTGSNRPKRVIYPGGYVVAESKIYVAYGKDDCEMWIATLDKQSLKSSLKAVNTSCKD
ncbi:MAG TPA: hypothetical protein VGJ00_02570 [Rhabdochlamydiaceae bacterium]